MMCKRIISIVFLLVVFVGMSAGKQHVKNIILDTDWWTDVDDACAIRIIHEKQKQGLVNLCGICLSSVRETSIHSISSFLDYEGAHNVYIGADKEATDFGGRPCYHDLIIQSHPASELKNIDEVDDCVKFYRKILSSTHGKIDIVAVGFPNALARLLESKPDEYSKLKGIELVKKKVNHLWLMAGKFPSGKEHNFAHGLRSCRAGYIVTRDWPTEITFLGWEIGIKIKAGAGLEHSDLLYKILKIHGSEKGRCAWDPLTVDMAINNSPEMSGFDVVRGTCIVDEHTGENTFVEDVNGNHEYVVMKEQPSWYENHLNSILLKK